MLSTQAEPGPARACLRASTLFGGLTESELDDLIAAMDWVVVGGGETVVRAGDPGDAMYVVVTGRLSVSVVDADGAERVIREVGSSASIGELALVTGEPRTATIRAVRDSLLGRLSRAAFDRLVGLNPGVAIRVTRVIAGWMHPAQQPHRTSRPATIVVLPLGDADARAAADQLEIALGTSIQILDPRAVDAAVGAGAAQSSTGSDRDTALAAYFDAMELSHALVVYVADADPMSAWNVRALRQADWVVLVATAATPPHSRDIARALSRLTELAPSVPRELVLMHELGSGPPTGTEAWLKVTGARTHKHMRRGCPADWQRLARHITGGSVGLVLGGGGARGFAHIGALRAFEETGVEIDRVGGTSMGAFVGALWACGHPAADIVEKCRRLWLGHRPHRGYTLPLVALLNSGRAERGMVELFGELRFEDQWRDYFCMSTNLTRNASVVHRMGLLRHFVLASMSIPGIAPPVIDNGDLLVDGGVLNNMPTDVMRATGADDIVAIDVSSRRDFSVATRYHKAPGIGAYFAGRLAGSPPFPSIVRIIERTATLASEHTALSERQRLDVRFIEPPVAMYDTFDMKRLDEIVEIGYRATLDAMRDWPTAVTADLPEGI